MTIKTPNLADIINQDLNVKYPDKIYDREDIWTLFDLFLKGEIDESSFEDSYYLMYTRDGATNISNDEKLILDHLGKVIHRFSPYSEDHALAPKVFATNEEVRTAILTAKDKLME